MKEINVPNSMCKSILNQNGMRVTPAAVNKFKELLLAWGSEISKKATDKVTAEKRKTISAEDLI